MFQKNYKYLFNNILFIFSIFLLITPIHGYYLEYSKVNADHQSLTETFNIDKLENYTYKLSYVHYGNIQEGMSVKIFINGIYVYEYSKDLSNIGSGAYKKSEDGIDITDYLVNGSNEFKIESRIWETNTSSPYYVVRNIEITEPCPAIIKLPIYFNVNFLTFILCTMFFAIRK